MLPGGSAFQKTRDVGHPAPRLFKEGDGQGIPAGVEDGRLARRDGCGDVHHANAGAQGVEESIRWGFCSMIFADRCDAGRRLARRLERFARMPEIVVLGVPRGGVTLAYEVARALHAPLDVLLSRKLGVPGNSELAFGAVFAGGGRYLDQKTVQAAGMDADAVERIAAEALQELNRRAPAYRSDRPPLQLAGRTVILVDDGIATGASAFAAIESLRPLQPARVVLAVPLAPPATGAWLRTVVDEFVALDLPHPFQAVGSFYQNFAPVEDAEVVDLLRRARLAHALDSSHAHGPGS